ncbi:MAG: inorganic phosphate transporter [Bacteroidales bacterium]|jgi:phosphate/sulfate permease|nr:inorganic phosphate transporter [Bacteroidales bacterium]
MEIYYLILVVVLVALAVSDLVVGVSNDAGNFLTPAFGSKAASRWVIYAVAGVGILLGACFSSGMMEVARKGIFHPDMFTFSEIVLIYLAVMISDIVLMDTFNSMGLPTSTTVSLVFELLGAAVAASLIKISRSADSMNTLATYINSAHALAIMSGILVSVAIAFVVGAIIQYFTRLLFSFNSEKTMKYFGGLFGGLSIAVMTYFLIIKGIKGATFVSTAQMSWLMSHIPQVLLGSFVVWTVVLQALYMLFRIDIPRIVILVGTFGLAMAFAANDLVNFVGVPMACFQSFVIWREAGMPDAATFPMEALKGEVSTPTIALAITGIIMVLTIVTSRKARNVIATTTELSRQSEGDERFGASMLSRLIVRWAVNINSQYCRIMPKRVLHAMSRRFEMPESKPRDASFDTIRAAVSLIVSGILISVGTSMKLPLSTTYVTFMVAMGTSLSDRAWGRDSAVYRISGVFAVVGGWFLTALVAVTLAGIVAAILFLGGKYMVFIFSALAIFMIFRTQAHFRRKAATQKTEEEEGIVEADSTEKAIAKVKKQVTNAVVSISQIYVEGVESFMQEKRKDLHEACELEGAFNKKTRKMKNKIPKVIMALQQKAPLESGHYYVQLVDYLRETHRSLSYIIEPLHEHLENNHKPFVPAQIMELTTFLTEVRQFFDKSLEIVRDEHFDSIAETIRQRNTLLDSLTQIERAQIKRIKSKEVNTRNAVLYFNLLSESKNLFINHVNMVKAQRDFFAKIKTEK